jgi:hypothetical protein
MSKKTLVILVAIAAFGVIAYFSPAMRDARFVNSLVARNLEARGGADAWNDVTSMRMAGQMDLGGDMIVPYTLEQKRPGMMCFEFTFDGAMSTQCMDGDDGWKIAPFRGRSEPQPMSELELREMADSSDPYGLLYDYRARGLDIDYLGIEQIDGRDVYKLQVTLPRGGIRWLYLDAETALDVKLAATRIIAGREYGIETYYSDWQDIEGLLIPARQETITVGDEASHFITVDSVTINPGIEDSRFHIPAVVSSDAGGHGANPS